MMDVDASKSVAVAAVRRTQSSPSFPARFSSILTDEGCQLVRPRGVGSRIASVKVMRIKVTSHLATLNHSEADMGIWRVL